MTKVLIGLSGGVDSAVSALLLQKAGLEVYGCNLLLTQGSRIGSIEHQKAQDVAVRLGIPLFTEDFKQDFENKVITYFINEYLSGKTPNPCVRCNPTVKFASLLKAAELHGIPKIATGHYARIIRNDADGIYYLHTSPSQKDQSYFLYRLGQEVLSKTLFPLGEFTTKDEIRQIGAQAGFVSAHAADSQEICFIPDNDYIAYIIKKTGVKTAPGAFLDINGCVIGTHSGIIHYTVGQRKGLGAFGSPKYVKYINAKDNTVTLCNAPERFTDFVKAENLFWTAGIAPNQNKAYGVKVRSTARAVPAELKVNGNTLSVHFQSPVLAPSPGQSAVIYDGDRVLGGGIIIG